MDSISVLIRREDKFFFTRENDNEDYSPISSELERGNTLRESLRENIRENTGVEIEIEHKLNRIEDSEDRMHWYLAEEVSASKENPDPDEIKSEDGQWLSLDEKEKIDGNTVEFIENHRDKIIDN